MDSRPQLSYSLDSRQLTERPLTLCWQEAFRHSYKFSLKLIDWNTVWEYLDSLLRIYYPLLYVVGLEDSYSSPGVTASLYVGEEPQLSLLFIEHIKKAKLKAVLLPLRLYRLEGYWSGLRHLSACLLRIELLYLLFQITWVILSWIPTFGMLTYFIWTY